MYNTYNTNTLSNDAGTAWDAWGEKEKKKGESPPKPAYINNMQSAAKKEPMTRMGKKNGGGTLISKDRPKKNKKPPLLRINDETRICLRNACWFTSWDGRKSAPFLPFPQTSPTKLIDGRGGGGRFPQIYLKSPNPVHFRSRFDFVTDEWSPKKKTFLFFFFLCFLSFWCFFFFSK